MRVMVRLFARLRDIAGAAEISRDVAAGSTIGTIWKHEYFEGGDVWIEGATADPDDPAARETAMRIACT